MTEPDVDTPLSLGAETGHDARLARRIAGAVDALGLRQAGPTSAQSPRPVQQLELAIDALDIAAIRPGTGCAPPSPPAAGW